MYDVVPAPGGPFHSLFVTDPKQTNAPAPFRRLPSFPAHSFHRPRDAHINGQSPSNPNANKTAHTHTPPATGNHCTAPAPPVREFVLFCALLCSTVRTLNYDNLLDRAARDRFIGQLLGFFVLSWMILFLPVNNYFCAGRVSFPSYLALNQSASGRLLPSLLSGLHHLHGSA